MSERKTRKRERERERERERDSERERERERDREGDRVTGRGRQGGIEREGEIARGVDKLSCEVEKLDIC